MQAPTAFFNRTYDEAFSLLVEARDYIAHGQAVERDFVDTRGQARMVLETTRLTARLTHVMAWLLARKAVFMGEISPETAAQPPYTLGRDENLAGDGPLKDILPPGLESLMERSQRLYIRVARLDELVLRDSRPA
jgi:regulator of CtrA degradation